jgi:hypothetical protein
VGFLPGEADAGTCVNAPLDHEKSVILEKFTEIMREFSLGFGADRQVKRHE